MNKEETTKQKVRNTKRPHQETRNTKTKKNTTY